MTASERTAGDRSAADGGVNEPEELRQEIREDRQELGETVEALAHKADVKARASEKVDETKQAAQETAGAVQAKARENPAPLIAAAVAGALLLLFLIRRR